MGAAALVSGSLLASRFLGLVRVSTFAYLFGTHAPIKEYNAAFRIPDTLFTIVAGGALSSAFVPVFAGLLERNQEQQAWRVANTVLNGVFVILIALAAIAFVLAPDLSRLLNPGFSAYQIHQTAELTRIMLVQPVLLGMGGLFAAMQNSYKRFVLPAVAPVLYNVAILVGAALFAPRFGVYAAAWAVVVGALIMFEVQIWGVARESSFYRISLDRKMKETREVLRLIGPRLLGLSAFQIMMIVTGILASLLSSTQNNSISYSWTLIMFPVGAIGSSLGIAMFPTLSRQAAGAQAGQVGATVSQSLRGIIFLALPATVGLILLRRPIIELLYARGAWTNASTSATALALEFYAFGIVPLAAIEIVTRAFYALRNTRTPVTIAVFAAAIDIVLCIVLFVLFGKSRAQGGLALGTSIAVWMQIILLVRALRRRLPDVIDVQFKKIMTAIVLSTLGMGVCVFFTLKVLDHVSPAGGTSHPLVEAAGSIFVGVVVYVLLARMMRVPEVGRLIGLARRMTTR